MVISMENLRSKPETLRKIENLTSKTGSLRKIAGDELGFRAWDLLGIWPLGFGISVSVAIVEKAFENQKGCINMESSSNEIQLVSVPGPDRRRPVPPWSLPERRGWAA